MCVNCLCRSYFDELGVEIIPPYMIASKVTIKHAVMLKYLTTLSHTYVKNVHISNLHVCMLQINYVYLAGHSL